MTATHCFGHGLGRNDGSERQDVIAEGRDRDINSGTVVEGATIARSRAVVLAEGAGAGFIGRARRLGDVFIASTEGSEDERHGEAASERGFGVLIDTKDMLLYGKVLRGRVGTAVVLSTKTY